jgi:hypothetical protein
MWPSSSMLLITQIYPRQSANGWGTRKGRTGTVLRLRGTVLTAANRTLDVEKLTHFHANHRVKGLSADHLENAVIGSPPATRKSIEIPRIVRNVNIGTFGSCLPMLKSPAQAVRPGRIP